MKTIGSGRHTFLCWLPELGQKEEDGWQVKEFRADVAAELFLSHHDWDSAERTDSCLVLVKLLPDGETQRFRVTSRVDVTYNAEALDDHQTH